MDILVQLELEGEVGDKPAITANSFLTFAKKSYGPDLLANHDSRPYVCLSDRTHPFHDEEALYAAATTTRRAVAIRSV